MRLWPSAGLWRHPDFLKLWSAETVSQFGSQITVLALPFVAIYTLHASAFEVAALTAVEFAPFVLLTLPAGVWVDRLQRRPILVVADFGRALVLGSIPLSAAFDLLTIWQLYAAAFGAGALTVFFDVAYQSYLPSLVDRGQLVDGNAKLEISRSAAQIGGPGLGGILVGAITAPYAILADAASFVGSALFVFGIRRREVLPEKPAVQPRMRRELMEGLKYLVRHRYWRPIAISTASFNFWNNVAFSILLVYAVRELDLSAALIGLVFALSNGGALLAAVLANRFGTRFGVGRTIAFGAVMSGLPLLLVPAAPKSFPIPFLVAAFTLSGFGIVLYNITGISLTQSLTPERLLGRINASRRFLVWGTIPFGSVLGGALASQIGLRPTLFVGTAGTVLASLPVVLSPVRRIETMPEQPEAAGHLVGDALPASAEPS